jgi:hypothetical protein
MSLVESDAACAPCAANGTALDELRVWAGQRSRAAHSAIAIVVQLSVAVAAASRALDAHAVAPADGDAVVCDDAAALEAAHVLHAATLATRDGCALAEQREWAMGALGDAAAQIVGGD